MKSKVVIFTSNNARILSNPENIDQYRDLKDCVIDPDLTLVQGLSPHHWKLLDGKVTPMTAEEQIIREEIINKHGADNDVEKVLAPLSIVEPEIVVPAVFEKPKSNNKYIALGLTALIAIGIFLIIHFRF